MSNPAKNNVTVETLKTRGVIQNDFPKLADFLPAAFDTVSPVGLLNANPDMPLYFEHEVLAVAYTFRGMKEDFSESDPTPASA